MVSTTFSQLAALAAIVAALASPTATALPRIDPGVHRTLRRQATVNLIVTLHQDTTAPLAAVQESNFDSRGAKIEALVQKLQAHATTTQADISKILLQESSDASSPLFTKTESLWISNELFFENATIELAEKLANMPSVASIREEVHVTLAADTPTEATANTNATTAASVEWGVSIIKAPEVWATGNTGQGTVVGVIDSGVLGTHEIFRNNFRSSYGWFDATARKPTPYDDGGHGSLSLGSAVGANGVGVAPGAQWIACRACTPTTGCSESAIKSCMQFMACPTDAAGKNPDCSKAPNVVNCSWGTPGSNTVFDAALKTWIAAGVIPVFSIGNWGMGGCSTVGSPGDSPYAIGVGATTVSDGLGELSSKGPSKTGLIKPDLAGPGINIRSAYIPSDTSYETVDGTSHAAPHVAGVVALMLSANKNLSFDQVRSILTSTAERKLQPSRFTCGGTPDATNPNNQYGAGRVHALNAVLKAASMAK